MKYCIVLIKSANFGESSKRKEEKKIPKKSYSSAKNLTIQNGSIFQVSTHLKRPEL